MGSYRILQRTIPAVCDSLTAVLGFIFVCVVIHGVRNQVTTDDDSFPTMRPTFTSNLIKRDDVRSSFRYLIVKLILFKIKSFPSKLLKNITVRRAITEGAPY